jgi:hypothetical protein
MQPQSYAQFLPLSQNHPQNSSQNEFQNQFQTLSQSYPQIQTQSQTQPLPVHQEAQVTLKTEFAIIVIGAIIFTASFIWKDFFSDIQNRFFPTTDKYFLIERFVNILITTIVLILIAYFLQKTFFQSSTQEQEKNALKGYSLG